MTFRIALQLAGVDATMVTEADTGDGARASWEEKLTGELATAGARRPAATKEFVVASPRLRRVRVEARSAKVFLIAPRTAVVVAITAFRTLAKQVPTAVMSGSFMFFGRSFN